MDGIKLIGLYTINGIFMDTNRAPRAQNMEYGIWNMEYGRS